MQFTPLDAGLYLKEQFDELFSRRDTLEQQRTQITKLQNDLKAKDSDVIGLSAQLKQLSDRTDIQALMNENKSLVELNHELRQKMNNRQHGQASQKRNVLIFVIAIIAAIVGMVLGRLI
ncbi:hypothetical protein SDC64_05515 [Acinetobacter haemolyticus]|uniref:hypothetical protein n=1 Tax=Acinetobacter haemolyticus TaxID=29430 RepID=UPI002A6A14A2|nr:hypothetical protein [Acinetobacter haemolyticus]WPO68385.1 hypothetical protein SDC64_05515 [Acinetobacter haemolyticus]